MPNCYLQYLSNIRSSYKIYLIITMSSFKCEFSVIKFKSFFPALDDKNIFSGTFKPNPQYKNIMYKEIE